MNGETENDLPASPKTGVLMMGVALTLLPMLVRVQAPMELLPYWDGDPLSQEAVVIGMTPPVSLIGDVVTLIGAALLLAFGPRRRAGSLLPMALVLGGIGACLLYVRGSPFNAKEAVLAGAWLSSAAAGFALWHAGSDRRVRRLTFAVVAGLIGLLAIKGLYQVVVEHPATVEAFKRDRLAILARNGWSEDSPMAKAYERRLLQSEATGWFGFSNIYASFAAMGCAVFAVLLAGLALDRRERVERLDDNPGAGRGVWVIVGGGIALSVGALVLAGAKGGYAAALLGVATGVALLWVKMRSGGEGVRRLARVVGPMAIVLPLLAVIARGFIGERVGELSLLFRWFYMQGAARIFSGNWLHGVGPDGFQAAYAAAKPPLSPEDVTSPHSILLDWAACLGIGGVALGAWLVWTSAGIGAVAQSDGRDAEKADGGTEHADDTRLLMRAACLIAAAASMAAIPMQYAAMLFEEAIGVRIGGLIVWCVLSCGALAASSFWRGWPVAVAAGAVALLAHTQIELTGMWMQSCGVVLALIGVASAGPGYVESGDGKAAPRWPSLVGAAATLAIAVAMLQPVMSARDWAQEMRSAYAYATDVRNLRIQLASETDKREIARLTAELARQSPNTAESVIRTLPGGWPLDRSASQIAMEISRGYASLGDARGLAASRAWAVRAVAIVIADAQYAHAWNSNAEGGGLSNETVNAALARYQAGSMATLDSARASWGATVCTAAADWLPENERSVWLALAAAFLKEANAKDPYNPAHLQRLMETQVRLGDKAAARVTAKRLLEVDQLQRLDRSVRGLSEQEKAKAERIASGG